MVKKNDIVICIDDDSQDEDLGCSGIVLSGTKGLVRGREYKIKIVDTTHVPKSRFRRKEEIWSKEDFEKVKWYWTYCWIEGEGFSGRVNLGNFKLKK